MEHEVRLRIDALVRHGRWTSAERDDVIRDRLALLARHVTVVAEAEYGGNEAMARDRIPRDPNDWPTVALALSMGIGIWTNDQDFFGCGVPVWTTETLLTHVASGRAAVDR